MGKSGPKTETPKSRRHLQSRISYLHQAAKYIARGEHYGTDDDGLKAAELEAKVTAASNRVAGETQSKHLLDQLRKVSLKSQIRLKSDIKHSICKRCESLLVSGVSSIERTQNQSKGGKKPSADVLEIQCRSCGTCKRFPIGQRRQKQRQSVSKKV